MEQTIEKTHEVALIALDGVMQDGIDTETSVPSLIGTLEEEVDFWLDVTNARIKGIPEEAREPFIRAKEESLLAAGADPHDFWHEATEGEGTLLPEDLRQKYFTTASMERGLSPSQAVQEAPALSEDAALLTQAKEEPRTEIAESDYPDSLKEHIKLIHCTIHSIFYINDQIKELGRKVENLYKMGRYREGKIYLYFVKSFNEVPLSCDGPHWRISKLNKEGDTYGETLKGNLTLAVVKRYRQVEIFRPLKAIDRRLKFLRKIKKSLVEKITLPFGRLAEQYHSIDSLKVYLYEKGPSSDE